MCRTHLDVITVQAPLVGDALLQSPPRSAPLTQPLGRLAARSSSATATGALIDGSRGWLVASCRAGWQPVDGKRIASTAGFSRQLEGATEPVEQLNAPSIRTFLIDSYLILMASPTGSTHAPALSLSLSPSSTLDRLLSSSQASARELGRLTFSLLSEGR